MSHPYLTRRAEIAGFFAILLLVGTVCAVVLGSRVVAVSAGVAAAVLLAVVIYHQIRFGPRISEVQRTVPWPPNSFRGRFGVFLFIFAVIGMLVVVLWQVLRGYKI